MLYTLLVIGEETLSALVPSVSPIPRSFPLQPNRSFLVRYWALSAVIWTLPLRGPDIKQNGASADVA